MTPYWRERFITNTGIELTEAIADGLVALDDMPELFEEIQRNVEEESSR